jgi:TolB-like protein/Flp pilus assembly protein TadD
MLHRASYRSHICRRPSTLSESSTGVFLSYASEDAQAAQRICAALRAAGIDVWFDQSEIKGGDAWDAAIRRQIKACSLFIPIISSNSRARAEGYFRLEWKLAVDRSHLMAADKPFLLPVVIDATHEADARVPDRFREMHWTRLPGGETSAAFVDRVARLLLPVQPSGPSGAVNPEHGAPKDPVSAAMAPNQRVTGRNALILASAAAVVVIAYFVANRFVLAPRAVDADRAAASVSAIDTAQNTMPEKSIAVLPFVDMSEKKDQEYFADGMAEEILNLLVKIPVLKVIGRTSSFQFKGKAEDLRKIGVSLGVTYVVEGSVRRSGDHVRVTAQLIDAQSGTHRWSETYDRGLGDVLALQSQIATSIARALQLAVGADDMRPPRSLNNTQAYNLYLRGRSAYDGPGDIPEAQSDYEQALALDPSFLRAAESLAWMYAYAGLTQEMPSHLAWQRAKDAAQNALRIDGNSAPAHAVLGLMHAEYEYDWVAADAEMNEALALSPRDPMTLDFASRLASHRGRYQEALLRIDASLAVDPLNPRTHRRKGFVLYFLGDDRGAEREYRRSLEIVPTFDWDHMLLTWILVARGDLQAALTESKAEPVAGARDQCLSIVYHALGRHAESDAALARLIKEFSEWGSGIAIAYAYRGEREETFKWLENAYSTRDADLLLWIEGQPFLQSFRSDPRYATLLRKMNLVE